MKYTRIDMPQKSKASSIKQAILFFVVLPLCAVMVGGVISRFLIVPYMNKNVNSEPTKSTVKVVEKSKEYSIYILQAGIFSTNENASSLSGTFNSLGIKSFVIHDKDGFRVIVGASYKDDTIKADANKLKNMGYTTVTKQAIVNSGIFKDNDDKVKIKDYVITLGAVLKQMEDDLSTVGTDKMSSDKGEEEAAKLEEEYKKINTSELQNSELKQKIENIHQNAAEYEEKLYHKSTQIQKEALLEGFYEAAVMYYDLINTICG